MKSERKQSRLSDAELEDKLEKLKAAYQTAVTEVKDLRLKQILTEHEYRNLAFKYGQVFKAGIGAEAVYQLVSRMISEDEIKSDSYINLKDLLARKYKRSAETSASAWRSMIKAKLHPSWMFITVLPVIPPDLAANGATGRRPVCHF